MQKWPLGCDTYVFSQQMKVKERLDDVIADISSAGFMGVELFAVIFEDNETRKWLDGLLKKHKLELVSAFFSARMWEIDGQASILDKVRRLAGEVASLGGHYLVLTYPPKGVPKSENEYAVQAETLGEIGQICRKNGLSATVHLYAHHVRDGELEVRKICETVPAEMLSLGPDLDWVSRGGVDPEDFLRRYGNRINYMHLRDNKNGRWTEALGEGDVDYASLARTLKEIDFNGWIVVELAHEKDFERTRSIGESLRLSREHLLKTMGI